MNRTRSLLLCLCAPFVFAGCSLFKHATGGLGVTSSVPADVYVAGKNMGSTPLHTTGLDVKSYDVKLIPHDVSMAPYEATLKVSSGFETTVDWTFAATKDASSGLVFEAENAQSGSGVELEIVTTPDNVPVTINNENKGFSPLVLDSLTEGTDRIGLQAPGFAPLTTDVKLMKGKRLVITAQLAKQTTPTPDASASASPVPAVTPAPTASPTPKPKPKVVSAKKPYVEVLDTPTGFLKIRSTPSTTGKILGQVKTGDTLPYAGTTTDNWFSVTYQASSSAWVSGQYSQLVK